MRALSDIDAGQVIGKDLEGMRGWFEVKNLSTGIAGSQRLGRIYYKPDGQRVLVSVHIKQDEKQQRRHIERLRALMHATHSINDPREMRLLHVLESNRALHRRREVVQRAAGRGDRC